jgi:hypothetical protein
MISCIDPQAQHQLGEARAKKDIDQDVVELGEKPQKGPTFFALW